MTSENQPDSGAKWQPVPGHSKLTSIARLNALEEALRSYRALAKRMDKALEVAYQRFVEIQQVEEWRGREALRDRALYGQVEVAKALADYAALEGRELK